MANENKLVTLEDLGEAYTALYNRDVMTAADKTKLDGIQAGAQVNTVTGVKGNAESDYRVGNVNLTPANIGAASSSEAIKSITRSGTTFTATRCDNTKFTFTQQDNNTTYSFSDKNATLSWGTKSTIATVGGVDIHVTMPSNPNTDHYAWSDITGKPSNYPGGCTGTAGSVAWGNVTSKPYSYKIVNTYFRNSVISRGSDVTYWSGSINIDAGNYYVVATCYVHQNAGTGYVKLKWGNTVITTNVVSDGAVMSGSNGTFVMLTGFVNNTGGAKTVSIVLNSDSSDCTMTGLAYMAINIDAIAVGRI